MKTINLQYMYFSFLPATRFLRTKFIYLLILNYTVFQTQNTEGRNVGKIITEALGFCIIFKCLIVDYRLFLFKGGFDSQNSLEHELVFCIFAYYFLEILQQHFL